jgi:hypothetical protein
MVTKNEHFITQMKLRELSIQRNRLSQAYNDLRQTVEQEPTETGRLRILFEGLRRITFANQKLHPDIANMEPLFEHTESEPISRETITFWRERLDKELSSGLLRSEIMYIFGALLEEWASAATSTRPESSEESEQIQTALVERLLQPTTTGNYTTLLDSLIADLAFSNEDECIKQFQEAVGDTLRQRVKVQDLVDILEQVSTNAYHPANLRKQAQDFLADTTMQKELSDALTIMLEHLDEWQRPQEGLPPRALWTFTKWRLCIDEDLPTACFLEILGQRWQSILQQFFNAERQARLHPFHHRQLTRATRTLFYNFQGFRPSTLMEIDIWDAEKQAELTTEEYLDHLDSGSILHMRLHRKSELRDLDQLSDYDALDKISNIEKALVLINAEIALARALPSTRPLHILKIDFKDFYPSLSHQLLLDILQRYGASPSQLAFFQTFLQIPLTYQGQTKTSTNGIPNYCQLSHLLGELVSGLFEHYLERSAHVQIIRAIDDICILGTSADEMDKAWQAIGIFCETCGIALNLEKCGSTCIGGDRLPFLPVGQPDWLLLTLDTHGDWQVNWNAFEHFLGQTRQHVMQSPSLISQIETYNSHLTYLVNALAMHADLGSSHRTGINTAMARFSQSFFGPGQSIIDVTRRLIRERFLDQTSNTQIPEAWLYWPITAGGCGLLQATILISGFNAHISEFARQSPRETPPKEQSSNWQYQNNAWSTFYNSFTNTFMANKPETNQVMEALVNDFIQRGSEVSNRHQASLSPYWRWILSIYGPQILDSLGTFRFLITELVPLQLIIQKYRQGATDEHGEGL